MKIEWDHETEAEREEREATVAGKVEISPDEESEIEAEEARGDISNDFPRYMFDKF